MARDSKRAVGALLGFPVLRCRRLRGFAFTICAGLPRLSQTAADPAQLSRIGKHQRERSQIVADFPERQFLRPGMS